MDPYKYHAMKEKAHEFQQIPGPYDSTYQTSYKDVRTYNWSPLYKGDRKARAKKEGIRVYSERNEPQTTPREHSPRPYRNSYRDDYWSPRSNSEHYDRVNNFVHPQERRKQMIEHMGVDMGDKRFGDNYFGPAVTFPDVEVLVRSYHE